MIAPFAIACGACWFCDRALTSACETTNPGPGPSITRGAFPPPAALYGYSHLYGGVPGGQAERVRVRMAEANAFKVPADLADERVLFLTDILPTGWQAVADAGVGPGSTVAIFGAGPVGQMAALAAKLLGAARIWVVDDEPARLAFAAEQGALPLHFGEVDDVADHLVRATDRRGVDVAVDAVGFEAKGNKLESTLRGILIESGSGTVLRDAIACVRRGGVVSIPGVYVGFLHGFMVGDAFDKGLRFAMGQTHVHRWVPELLGHVAAGRLRPEAVITHRLPLDDGPDAYALFAAKRDGCRKVVLYPGGRQATA